MRGHVSLHMARAPPRMRASQKRPAHAGPHVKRLAPLAAFWTRIRRRQWMTEEDARWGRRHSLLQDNPASG